MGNYYMCFFDFLLHFFIGKEHFPLTVLGGICTISGLYKNLFRNHCTACLFQIRDSGLFSGPHDKVSCSALCPRLYFHRVTLSIYSCRSTLQVLNPAKLQKTGFSMQNIIFYIKCQEILCFIYYIICIILYFQQID